MGLLLGLTIALVALSQPNGKRSGLLRLAPNLLLRRTVRVLIWQSCTTRLVKACGCGRPDPEGHVRRRRVLAAAKAASRLRQWGHAHTPSRDGSPFAAEVSSMLYFLESMIFREVKKGELSICHSRTFWPSTPIRPSKARRNKSRTPITLSVMVFEEKNVVDDRDRLLVSVYDYVADILCANFYTWLEFSMLLHEFSCWTKKSAVFS